MTAKRPNVATIKLKIRGVIDTLMKPLGCAPYPQTRRHPRAAAGPMHPSTHEYHAYNFLGFVQLVCLVILFKRF
jgi:hypothetical protein